MTDLRTHEVDPADEPDLRACWEVLEEVAAERPYDDSTPWATFRGQRQSPRTDQERTLLLATDAGRPVGVGEVVLHLLDNTHLGDLGVAVRPQDRRRGVGAALLRELEHRSVAAGRRTMTGGYPAPLDDGGPGAAFAAAHGYLEATSEEVKLVDLVSAAERWPALDEDVAAHLAGYRVETFVDTVPEHWVEDFCALLSVFMENIPLGDLELENAVWTPERLAEHVARMAAGDRAWLGAVAVTPEGRLCGFTELALARAHPVHASVGGTLVLPEHRGHRLGLALKLASHRLLGELFPACSAVLTGNAGVNAPMNAVNEQLGYRVVERWVDVQKKVTAS